MDKATFLDLLGPAPTRPAALEVSTLEITDCGSYTRHLLTYKVEENEKVTAFVCIPKNLTNKVPGIFCHHQHNGEFNLGKSEAVGLAGNPEQAYAAELAERGYVTFAADALAFENRNWHDEPFLAETYEATARISSGTTFMAKLLHDISVGIDVLQGIDEVDTDRIGFIGHSYGGKMAFWACAYDHRITSAVSHCGSTSLRRSLEKDAGILPEQTIPGFLNYGDIVDVAKLSNAKLLVSGTTDDIWSDGVKELHDSLSTDSSVYSEYALFEGEHAFSKDMRHNAYDFLHRTL